MIRRQWRLPHSALERHYGLGIIGAYTWRAYENTKRRPQAIVLATRVFPGKANRAVQAQATPATLEDRNRTRQASTAM